MSRDKDIWNETIKNLSIEDSAYDGWLDKYGLEGLSTSDLIIELGCGWGDDTCYLKNLPARLISCDFSDESISLMERRFPKADLAQFDLRAPFPFLDDSAEIIVADLCLHYFSDQEMAGIMKEIRRVLKDGGQLLCRVNSNKDPACGPESGWEIQEGLFFDGDAARRFFNREMIEGLFKPLHVSGLSEYVSDKYPKKKVLWEFTGQNWIK